MTPLDVVTVASVAFGIFSGVMYLRLKYRGNEEVRRANRRMVAYEGKLRQLGESPDRVYHDFENMLTSPPEDRKADDFEPDVRFEEDDG